MGFCGASPEKCEVSQIKAFQTGYAGLHGAMM